MNVPLTLTLVFVGPSVLVLSVGQLFKDLTHTHTHTSKNTRHWTRMGTYKAAEPKQKSRQLGQNLSRKIRNWSLMNNFVLQSAKVCLLAKDFVSPAKEP